MKTVAESHTGQELVRMASEYSAFIGEKVTPFVLGKMKTTDPMWIRFLDWIEGSAIG